MPRRDPSQPFQVRRSGIHGRGAFALRRIRPGTRIIEYIGERISDKEGDKRYPLNGQAHYHTFLFSILKNVCIDAAVRGNDARFLNHSCDPNCEAVEEEGRIFIEAIRNIQPGVELTYDYHLTGVSPRTEAEKAQFSCECGAENCRGSMLDSAKTRKRRKNR